MKETIIIYLVIILACTQVIPQENNKRGFIQTNRLFLFDSENGNQADLNGQTYNFNFQRRFSLIPRIGLSVYTMDFQFNASFSCQVSGNIRQNTATLLIRSQNRGRNNKLYIMYIATDHDFMGIFMPGQLLTSMLNIGIPGLQTESFIFNFKEQISSLSSRQNIRLSVYLTGISSSAELVSNGYPTNHTYFFMRASILSTSNYQIDVSVNSLYGDIAINLIEYTIIYFDVTFMESTRYQMDQGVIFEQNFGGTIDSSSKTTSLAALNPNPIFQNIQIFYGLSGIEAKQGASITISATHQLYRSPVNNNTLVSFNLQTWKLTVIMSTQYNFIQYKSLRCDITGSNCDENCIQSSRPHYFQNNVCYFCHSSCLTCNISLSSSRCDSCDATRQLNSKSGLCSCKGGFYDSLNFNICDSCFPCATCNIKGICLSCDGRKNLILNTVLSKCQCGPSFYPNYISTLNNTINIDTPCLACDITCLHCLNASFCLACNLQTYLTANGKCLRSCSQNEKYNNIQNSCTYFGGSGYDQSGRLGYDWSYNSNQSILQITMTFSQSNIKYYYYQNGQGYDSSFGSNIQSSAEKAVFYFDDGQSTQGFTSTAIADSIQSHQFSMNENAANIFSNSNFNNFDFGQSASAVGNLFQQGAGQVSGINGSFYGLGQRQFYRYLYRNYLMKQSNSRRRDVVYYDNNGIPLGKYNLSTNQAIKNPSYVQAVTQNVNIQIEGKSIPFSAKSKSNNQFILYAPITQSYYGKQASLIVKNPGLMRSDSTSLQVTNASKSIYIYACSIPSYVDSANSIKSSNSIIVDVLWGLGKYPLFIGFGWIFMPLMIAMQFIMSLNYVKATMPLNLQLFLSSFADFRNPSIFYNPLRKQIDQKVVSHKEIYMTIPHYQVFDRGIDFLKNTFQFFFVPFLSVILYGLIVGINKILNCFQRDIPLISQYIAPRLPLHIAAYTLVQALPVSFFFFAQLNDTKYSSINQPNAVYPIFNVALSYLAFFLTCSIPLLVMAYIYYMNSQRQNKVKTAKGFKEMFLNLLQSKPNSNNKASINDPIWSGDPVAINSYSFGISIFYFAIIYGFFTSFFYNSFQWQLTGLILITILFLSYSAASNHFQSLLIKIFWILFAILLIAFLLILAGISSNISPAPCGQQNIGYLAIGFVYTILFLALIASGYLLWLTIRSLYLNYFKDKKLVVNLLDQKGSEIDKRNERLQSFHSTNKLKSTYLKNPLQSQIGGSRMNIGSVHHMTASRYRIQQPMNTAERMIIKEEEQQPSRNMRERLVFYLINPNTGQYVFIGENNKIKYYFDSKTGSFLKGKEPIQIDINEDMFDKNKQFLGNYNNLKIVQDKSQFIPQPTKDPKSNKFTLNQRQQLPQGLSRGLIKTISVHQNLQIYEIDDEEYRKQGQDNNGMWIMRNIKTNEIKRFNADLFDEQEDQNVHNNIKNNKVQQIKTIYIINGQQYLVEGRQPNGNWILRNINTRQLKKLSDNQLKKFKLGDKSNTTNLGSLNPADIINKSKIYNINGVNYSKQDIDKDGLWIMKNINTGQIMKISDKQLMNGRILQNYNKESPVKVNNSNEKIIYIINGNEYILQQKDVNGLWILRNTRTREIVRISDNDLIKTRKKHVSDLPQMSHHQINEQIKTNRIVFPKQRKFKWNGNEYMDIGQQNGMHKVYNLTKNKNQLYKPDDYVNMVSQSFQQTININGKEYEFDGQGLSKSIHLIQTNTKKLRKITQEEFNLLKTQNQEAFKAQMGFKGPAITSSNTNISQKIIIDEGGSINNNILLLQSKAQKSQKNIVSYSNQYIDDNKRQGNPSANFRAKTQIQMSSYNHHSPPQTNRQLQQQDDDQSIQGVLKKSPGPFHLFVVPANKVNIVNDEDHYLKQDAIEKIILQGRHVMRYMENVEKKYPGSALFMIDMHKKRQGEDFEQYKLL